MRTTLDAPEAPEAADVPVTTGAPGYRAVLDTTVVTADGDVVHLSVPAGITVTVEPRPATDSYYTPRAVIETLAEMISDSAIEITDPAMGAGAFLTAALLAAQLRSPETIEALARRLDQVSP
ncbi:N-6 DNA methylase [Streptomyces sp. 150FB]|uniref:N-6 DNA methylase n=1 Tax=Streptomyces sp. 150FB TaxID=1576605 RepID=UPI0022A974A9|nr:N-6 DNA methylase [Streptomyces sp. 150FB]